MFILVVQTQKGGSGKTTLTGHLAVQAEMSGAGPVGVLDADPQQNLLEWAQERAEPSPVVEPTSLLEFERDVRRMRDRGIRLLVIDSPPGLAAINRSTIAMSDLVVIPVKPSPHDLRSAGKTVGLVDAQGKPLVFVVNSASPWARITLDSVAVLAQHGPVAPVIVHQRSDFASSMIDGRTVMEVDRRSPSAAEINQLWEYLNARLNADLRPGELAPLEDLVPA